MPDYRWRWNNYKHPALVAAFDMSTLTPGGLLKNLGSGGATYDATIFGAPAYVNPLIKAKRTKAMSFGGVNEYLSLANPVNGLSAFSFVLWANCSTVERTLFCRATNANLFGYHGYGGTGKVQFMSGDSIVSPNVIPISTPYMYVATFSSGNRYLYLNGKQAVFRSAGTNPADANLFIGQYFGGVLRWNGIIDNFMVFNTALTPEQIWAIKRSSEPRM